MPRRTAAADGLDGVLHEAGRVIPIMGRKVRSARFGRPMLPRPKEAYAAIVLGLVAFVGAALLVPGHSGRPASGVMAIPPPPDLAFGAAPRQFGSAPSSSISSAGSPTVSPSRKKTSSPKASPPLADSISPQAGSTAEPSQQATVAPPVAGANYAGSLVLNETGAQLASWNPASASYCTESSWMVTDGSVSTNSGGDVVLTTTGEPGSCVGIVSPGAYSSDVIEADVDLPALPGDSGTIANWSGIWLTDRTDWPDNGELDAVETVPNNGESGVTWHWGTVSSPLSISTGGAPEGTLPIDGPNITPGWHVVDIVYTKGFFAVYYDGTEYTSLSSDIITGSALSILITELVAPDNSEVEQEIAGPPTTSDSLPADIDVKYVRIWSFK